MKNLLNRVWQEDEGVLTFEWILLLTVLVIGIVGGLSAVRDAVISELGDVAEAITNLDQSYTIIGRVIAGMDVVESLTPRDPNQGTGLPPGDIIETITITEE